MPSERTRKLLPYISIGVGILVYVLYYNSTQNWKQAQSDYERQQVEERQAKKRANSKLLDEAKPWISNDGSEIFKITNREDKEGLLWIQLSELKENITYNLRQAKSASGEKYTSNLGNVFWIKGKEAVFENAQGKISKLYAIEVFQGLYSYMADANSFQNCETNQNITIAFEGKNIDIEKAYAALEKAGEQVYLEIEGAIIQKVSMEKSTLIDALYPYKFVKMEDRNSCR